MVKVFMVCDSTDDKASKITGCPNIGVEFMGHCSGRILYEDGTEIGRHHSSSLGWLRNDLISKLPFAEAGIGFDVVDLVGEPVPDQFKLPEA